jgi:hypothetical protein
MRNKDGGMVVVDLMTISVRDDDSTSYRDRGPKLAEIGESNNTFYVFVVFFLFCLVTTER